MMTVTRRVVQMDTVPSSYGTNEESCRVIIYFENLSIVLQTTVKRVEKTVHTFSKLP